MTKWISILLFLCALPVFGQQTGFEAGNKAYAAEDYKTALNEYSKLIGEGYISANLYYNLGNAYYRNKETGKAIWAYEKALKIDPSHQHAKENLEFTNLQTVDKLDNSRPGLGSWLEGLLFGPNVNLWAWLSILASMLFAASLTGFFISKTSRGKNFSLLTGSGFGLLLVFTFITAYMHKSYITHRQHGIIITASVEIKISPLPSASTSFTLHEGAKVEISGNNEDWVEVEVNGNSGWLLKKEVWEI